MTSGHPLRKGIKIISCVFRSAKVVPLCNKTKTFFKANVTYSGDYSKESITLSFLTLFSLFHNKHILVPWYLLPIG